MKTSEIEIGQRIYNRGDMANIPHFGTITKIKTSDRFSDMIEITPDNDIDRDPYWVYPSGITDYDLGHGGTRIVTIEAYHKFRNAQIEKMERWIQKTASL